MTPRLRIVRAGPLVTLQDRGRHGFRRYGVSVSGPMDWTAHGLALALAGCAAGDPAFEVGPGGLTVEAEGAPVRIGVAGFAHRAEIGAAGMGLVVVPAPARIVLEPGQRLTLRASGAGVWGALAAGGLDPGPPVLGSHAFNPRTALGPPRPVEGACYPCLAAELAPPLPHLDPLLPMQNDPVRILPGPQHHLFPREAREALVRAPYEVTRQADRMAYRVTGPPVLAPSHDIVSDGLVEGAMQVPPDGQPLVLCADRAPTGGYAKIAVVSRADLPRLVQMRAGDAVRFTWSTLEDAQARTAMLERVVASPEPRRRRPVHPAFLASLARRRRA